MMVLLFMQWWRTRLVLHVDLVGRKDTPDAVDEGEGILLCPEVDVEGVEFIVVFVLVPGVVGGQVPFFIAFHVPHRQADHTVMSIRVGDMDSIQDCSDAEVGRVSSISPVDCMDQGTEGRVSLTTVKGIQLIGSGMVCDLYARPPFMRILEQVDI